MFIGRARFTLVPSPSGAQCAMARHPWDSVANRRKAEHYVPLGLGLWGGRLAINIVPLRGWATEALLGSPRLLDSQCKSGGGAPQFKTLAPAQIA